MYILNQGTKRFIFVTLMRTGPKSKGRNTVSLLLIPRTKGVYTSLIKLQLHLVMFFQNQRCIYSSTNWWWYWFN